MVCVVFVASTAPAVLASQSGDARDQGRQAVERKPQKTKAEERIESGLLSAIERDERGEAAPSGRRAALDVDAKGRLLLDIRAEVDALRATDADAGTTVTVYHDRDEPLALRVSWYGADRTVVGQLEPLASDYLFLTPPAPVAPPAPQPGGGR